MKRRRSSARPFFNELARLRAGVPCTRAVRRVNERRSNRFQEVRGHYQSQSPDNHSSRCDSSLTLTLSLSFSLLSWMYAGLQLFFFFLYSLRTTHVASAALLVTLFLPFNPAASSLIRSCEEAKDSKSNRADSSRGIDSIVFHRRPRAFTI